MQLHPSMQSRTLLAGISAVLQQELMSQKQIHLSYASMQGCTNLSMQKERQFKLQTYEFHESALDL